MLVVNMERLLKEEEFLSNSFNTQKPFKYLVIDDFLYPDKAEQIFSSYPAIEENWKNSNGFNTKGKWANTAVENTPASNFYKEINSPEFLEYLGKLTKTPNLIQDPGLQGAGLHQIREGGYLNVHIDFNRLDGSNLDRRLNLIVYMNPDWKEEYGGHLELWDMDRKERIANISPLLNRCVIFETNEVSYHGHPTPVKSGGITRKSLSVYYYTQGRDDVVADTHSTVYVNTEGVEGKTKLFKNSLTHAARKLAKTVGGKGNF